MSVLDSIIEGVREDASAREVAVPLGELRARLADVDPPSDPLPGFRAPGSSVIAEVKRSSPSKGALAEIADPAALARSYAAGGAAAISVLTEQRRFHGSLDDLRNVRAAVDTPLLRKDFMVNSYQVVESRVAGADLVLLIVAALDDDTFRRLYTQARELGMRVLVEVHNFAELERALAIEPEILGVNARNLKTLGVDPGVFATLVAAIPDNVVAVAESGINGPDDVQTYVNQGAHAVLVGESLVRGGEPTAAVKAMTGLEPNA